MEESSLERIQYHSKHMDIYLLSPSKPCLVRIWHLSMLTFAHVMTPWMRSQRCNITQQPNANFDHYVKY